MKTDLFWAAVHNSRHQRQVSGVNKGLYHILSLSLILLKVTGRVYFACSRVLMVANMYLNEGDIDFKWIHQSLESAMQTKMLWFEHGNNRIQIIHLFSGIPVVEEHKFH